MAWSDLEYPTVALIVVLVVTGAALAAGLSTSATAYGPYNYRWDGGSELRTTVGAVTEETTIARSTTVYEELEPAESVAFVVSPTERHRTADAARVRQFVARGGTLVVADQGNQTNALLAELGIETRINGTSLRDEQEYYRGPGLPEASNVSEHPLTQGVEQLTLNHGTILDVPQRDRRSRFGSVERDSKRVRVIVRSSEFSYLDANENETLDDTETLQSYPVAALERVGSGRVVVLSDASVFTNAMLERSGNRAFVGNLAGNASIAVLDYSHGRPLPAASSAMLILRDTTVLQALVGLVGLLAIAIAGSGRLRRSWDRLAEMVDRAERHDTSALGRQDPAALAALVERRHPDWDRERIERVSQRLYDSDDTGQ